MILSEVVSPNSVVARSVNLERDMGDERILGQYILTGKGLEIIHRLVSGLNGEKISAWSLTGPYGMGKSSFSNFLLSLCGPEKNNETQLAINILTAKAPDLYAGFRNALNRRGIDSKGFFRVPVTSAFLPVNRTLAMGLRRSLKISESLKKNVAKALTRRIDSLLNNKRIDAPDIIELFEEAGRRAGQPIAVVIDEFGKNLEFMARYPGDGDLYLLQLLAESADIYLWVCLHQAFDEYASGLSDLQIREWGKIQGRFEDIAFVEPKTEMLRFIGKALIRKKHSQSSDRYIQQWTEAFIKKIKKLKLAEFKTTDAEMINGFYPLHPLAALILPELCVRFAQNDRTLFAFLCGGEPNALPAFLSSGHLTVESELRTLPVELLYDYFLSSTRSIALNRPESRRQIEIHTLIDGLKALPETEYKIVKIIGLLNLISGHIGFKASENLISFALFNPLMNKQMTSQEIKGILTSLAQRGILNYREYADEYRLWEGADFDIIAAIRAQEERLAGQPLKVILQKTLPLVPVAASRHYHKTGTLRYFERQWIESVKIASPLRCASEESDGLMLYAFGKEELPRDLPHTTEDGKPVVIAYTRNNKQIQEMAVHAAASEKVLQTSPELDRDGVARKEARFRAHEAQVRLKRFLTELFAPGHPDVCWYAEKREVKLKSFRELSALLSSLCDRFYPHCPEIHNELINRQQLSGAASGARRKLIEAMLTGESAEQLGMEGTGPETAIYRTMLLSEKLHVKGVDGVWRFEPPAKESSYFPVWQAIESMVTAGGDAPVMVTELTHRLSQPSFGMKTGVIPILIGLFLFVRTDEAALYQEGAFIPYIGPEDMELMVKRPEYFSIKRFAPKGIHERIFRIYQELLNTRPAVDGRLRNASMINIVGPLVRFAETLPEYVKNTRLLSAEARNLLRALLNAKDPIDLLFAEIPQAICMQAFKEDETVRTEDVKAFQVRLRNAVTELAGSFERLLEHIRGIVSKAFGAPKRLADLRKVLNKRAAPLVSRCTDSRLKPFAAALQKNRGEDSDWLITVATVANRRPADAWRDSDLPVFATRFHDLARRLMAMESLAAAERRHLPDGEEGMTARLVSIAKPDGAMESEVFRIAKNDTKKLKPVVAELIETYANEAEIKALFVLLGDYLMTPEKNKAHF